MGLTDSPICDGKVCPRCPEKGQQPATAFSPNAARPDGLQTYCKPCTREYARAYGAENRERERGWGRAYRERLRAEMFDAYGHECACCGEAEEAFLCLEHIDGLPDHHRTANGVRLSTDKILAILKREGWPEGFEILCANCNLAREKLGRCPHERQLRAVV